MIHTYYIGGSPCSGKSTVTEILAKKYNLYYFKVDDFLDKYLQKGVERGYAISQKQNSMTLEEIFSRDPVLQCAEELDYYEEIIEFILEDLAQLNYDGIITEGAAYTPKLMKKLNVPQDRYISITPTEEFQVFHYKQREWIKFILDECNDKEKVFSNWMKRDMLFAKEVQRQCDENHYVSMINDGTTTVEALVAMVETHFGLNESC